MKPKYIESTFWQSNPEWYVINENHEYSLIPDAPSDVRQSFLSWKAGFSNKSDVMWKAIEAFDNGETINCPFCNTPIHVEKVFNSYRVNCETEGCFKTGLRGL